VAADAGFEFEIRPRWPDFDALGHLNQAVYHVYLDEARDDALRRTVGAFDEWPNVLAHVSIDYVQEVSRGVELVSIVTRIVDVGRSSVRFAQTVRTSEHVAAESESVVVAWDPETRGSRAIASGDREKLGLAQARK